MMKDADRTEIPIHPVGKPLSLRQARGIVIVIGVSVLLWAAMGIHEILIGEKQFAFVFCFVATLWLAVLLVYVNIYLQVKRGKRIVLISGFFNVPLKSHSLSVPFFAGLLTLLAAAVGYMSFAILYPIFKTTTQHQVIVGINLFLWLVVVFLSGIALASPNAKSRSGLR